LKVIFFLRTRITIVLKFCIVIPLCLLTNISFYCQSEHNTFRTIHSSAVTCFSHHQLEITITSVYFSFYVIVIYTWIWPKHVVIDEYIRFKVFSHSDNKNRYWLHYIHWTKLAVILLSLFIVILSTGISFLKPRWCGVYIYTNGSHWRFLTACRNAEFFLAEVFAILLSTLLQTRKVSCSIFGQETSCSLLHFLHILAEILS
jgi:hypothetical protein